MNVQYPELLLYLAAMQPKKLTRFDVIVLRIGYGSFGVFIVLLGILHWHLLPPYEGYATAIAIVTSCVYLICGVILGIRQTGETNGLVGFKAQAIHAAKVIGLCMVLPGVIVALVLVFIAMPYIATHR